MKKRFWALLLAVMMVVSVLPTAAFAEDPTEPTVKDTPQTKNDKGVNISKSVTDNNDGTYKVTLESWVEGTTEIIPGAVDPMDIVLVLDVSGSMADGISIVTSSKPEKIKASVFPVLGAKSVAYLLWKYNDTEIYYKDGDSYYKVIDMKLTGITWTYTCEEDKTFTVDVKDDIIGGNLYRYVTVEEEQSKLELAQKAINGFIDAAAGSGSDHNISVVKFAGNKLKNNGNSIGDDMYDADNDPWAGGSGQKYNYTQIVVGLTSVKTGADTLKAAVNGLKAAGATSADLGMQLAQKVLNERSDKTRKSVVIFFTDGEPNHHSGFDAGVANDAISNAKSLKGNDTTIYTIGVMKGADPTDIRSDFNRFMHYVSSNYPNAESMTKPGSDGNMAAGFYKTATNAAELNKIFKAIADETVTKPTTVVNADAILTDTVSKYFTPVIPEDENVEAVTVEVWSAGGNEETATWTKDVSASDITVSVENKKISVTGFDYSANAVVKQGDSWTGKKLVVSFDITPDTSCDDWQPGMEYYPTNDTAESKAGLYPESGEAFASLDRSPDVPITAYSVTYSYSGETPFGAPAVPTAKAYLPGTEVFVAPAPTLRGYSFSGWTTKANVGISENKFTMPECAVALTGSWSENPPATTYSVTYNWTGLPDGKEVYTGTGAEKVKVTLPEDNTEYADGASYLINSTYTSDTVAYTTDDEGNVKDRYIFSGWDKTDGTIDKASVKVNGTWYLDNWQDNEKDPDQPTGGDGTPDKYQVLVKYESADSVGGTVNPEYEVITLTNGEVLLDTANVRVSGSTAAPNPGYSFEKWTDNGDNTVTETIAGETTKVGPELPPQTIPGAKGGTIYTYTAYWTENVPNLSVEKTVASVGGVAVDYTAASVNIPTAKIGDTIKWTITVTNNGDEDVTIQHPVDKLTITKGNAVTTKTLTAVPKEGDAAASYTLVAGASKEFTVEYTVLAEDLNAQIYNSATVNGVTGSTGKPVNVGATPGLSVTKTVNKTSVTVGDTVKYTITVKNTGNVDLTNVNVVEAFGGDFSKITNVTGADQVTKNGFVIHELKAGSDPVEITFSYKTTKRETLTNSVVVEGTYEPGKTVRDEDSSAPVTVKSEPITPVGPSKPQLNYEDHYAYVVGYPDGLVHPERNITRAEVATIFFRMLLDESREYFWAQENDFSDVAETDWFNNAVSTLANAQLINGYPDGSYRPNANITRAEFATIAIRFFLDEDVEIEENNLSDVKGHWAEANINLAYALELINGYPDGTFRPDQKITRAEAMAIVNRVLKRAPEKDHLLKDMIEWPDNLNTAAWYYADVQEATNSHKFHMDKEEEYEIWTELLPVRDWVALEQEWSKANSSKNPGEVVDIKITTPEAGDNGLKLD